MVMAGGDIVLRKARNGQTKTLHQSMKLLIIRRGGVGKSILPVLGLHNLHNQ